MLVYRQKPPRARPVPSRGFASTCHPIVTNMSYQIGYCTNVHAGANLAQTRENLEKHAVAVKAAVCPDREMGIGLWLSANSASELLSTDQIGEFADWLGQRQLIPFTLNGFPYGDFHERVVKHRVYKPTWYEKARLDYTLNLIEILDRLLPPRVEGSISTLPVCWGNPPPTAEAAGFAATQLRHVADRLAELESSSGRLIYVCLEPEPGCYLQRSEDIISFFNRFLLPVGNEERIRRHIRVCHDVCHAAVMFEEQADVFDRFRAAGVRVGKVQVSSAVLVDFMQIQQSDRAEAVRQLAGFAEDRYLHQTTVRDPRGKMSFFEDLPAALDSIGDPGRLVERWSIHFHVPVYLDKFGHLGTSQTQIQQCLDAARGHPELSHLEVETYAWGVLPGELKQPNLASGIALELNWLAEQLQTSA